MNLWLCTLAHNEASIILKSVQQVAKTATLSWQKIMVDHHWPIDEMNHQLDLVHMATAFDYRLLRPYENMGGHKGYQWAIDQLPLDLHDYVVTCDGDVWPETIGWDEAAISVLEDPRASDVASVSLMCQRARDAPDRVWKRQNLGDHTVAWPTNMHTVMDVTVFRASFLKAFGFPQGLRPYYGYVEDTLFETAKKANMRCVFLEYYTQLDFHPDPPNPLYVQWKIEHTHKRTTDLNFNAWLIARGHKT